MRKTLLFLFTFILSLTSCEDNFDEVKDSSQRSITLKIDTDNIFSNVLLYEDGTPVLCADTSLGLNQRLRIVAYCYDKEGYLLQSQTCLVDNYEPVDITIRHLLKEESYHFVVIADIVENDAYVGYYETWYQLETDCLDSVYITSLRKNDNMKYNSLMSASFYESPSNQVVHISLSPIIYNGYLLLTNTENLYLVKVSVGEGKSCFLSNLNRTEYELVNYEFPFPNSEEKIIPIITWCATDSLSLDLIVINQKGEYKKGLNFANMNSRPFMAQVDCKNMSISNLEFY